MRPSFPSEKECSEDKLVAYRLTQIEESLSKLVAELQGDKGLGMRLARVEFGMGFGWKVGASLGGAALAVATAALIKVLSIG